MTYTRAWSISNPPGSQAANTADDEIRNLRGDIDERMRDIINDWTTDPVKVRAKCKVYRTAAQGIPNGTVTQISFDAESFDDDAMHDGIATPTKIIVPTALRKGIWMFACQVTFAQNTSGIRTVAIYRNGIIPVQIGYTQFSATSPVSNDHTMQAVGYADLDGSSATGAEFFVSVTQGSGASLNVQGDSSAIQTWFAAVQLG